MRIVQFNLYAFMFWVRPEIGQLAIDSLQLAKKGIKKSKYTCFLNDSQLQFSFYLPIANCELPNISL